MAKKNKNRPVAPAAPAGPSVVFRASPAFKRNFEDLARANPAIIDALARFKAAKTANPLAPASGKDKAMVAGAPIGNAIPGIRHAHLDQDISIFYKLSGRDPTVFKLYDIARHADSGTGNPPKIRTQSDFASRLQTSDRRDDFSESRKNRLQ